MVLGLGSRRTKLFHKKAFNRLMIVCEEYISDIK